MKWQICASVMRLRWNVFKENWITLKMARWSRIVFFFPHMEGDEEGLTESFFTLISEDMEKEWLPSVVLRANKDFSAVVPTTRDKCLTEGYSPSCGILMICSRHTPISLVVHEALWHTLRSGPSVRAQPHVVGPPFFCRSQLWRPTKKIKPILWCFCKQLCTTHWS